MNDDAKDDAKDEALRRLTDSLRKLQALEQADAAKSSKARVDAASEAPAPPRRNTRPDNLADFLGLQD